MQRYKYFIIKLNVKLIAIIPQVGAIQDITKMR